MPLPKPRKYNGKYNLSKFRKRWFSSLIVKREFPKPKQKFAVMMSRWRKRRSL